MNEYKTIQLPQGIVKLIDTLVSKEIFGYSSRAEVVKEAVRQLFDKRIGLKNFE